MNKKQLKKIKLFTSLFTFTNSYTLLTILTTNADAKNKITVLESRVLVLESNQGVIKQALLSRFVDFEDAVQHFTAAAHTIDILLTRNLKDYKNAVLKVKSPEVFLMD